MPSVGIAEVAVLLVTIGVYVAIAVAIVLVVVRLVGRRRDPRRVQDDRLARGEITPAEYQEARRILGA